MRKYTLVLAMGLLTTAAVTATVLANKAPQKKEVNAKKVEKKVEKKKSCSREKTSCFFS